MRRLKVNKKSLMQRGGTPARKMAMDTDTILQDIREKVQGGVSEVEIFQNLMEQEIPLDEIQTAFSALGYDETMLSNIMEAVQQSASVQEEPIGEVQGSELPQAQYGQGFFGGNPFLSGTLATYHKSPDGYMPAKGFYLPQDLGNRGNIFGAISTATEAFSNLFSGKDLDGDGLKDGSLRNLGAKRRRHRDNKGSYYTYDVEYDPNDTNTYALDPSDLYAASKNRGRLRTTQQYTQDLLDNSMINYNVNTGQYETLISPNEIKANRFGKNDPNKNILEGKSFSDFYTTLKDNPAHLEMLAQQMGMIKGDYLPAGVSYGVDEDGSAASYFGANPYLYETMMGINVAKGDKSKEYTAADLNTNPNRISLGGFQNNVGISNANTRSNVSSNLNNSSGLSSFDLSSLPVVDPNNFVKGRSYTSTDRGYVDTTDILNQLYPNQTPTNTSASTTGSTSVNTQTDPNASAVIDGVTYTVSDPVTKQEGGSTLPNYGLGGGGGAGRGPAVATNRHTSQNSISTGVDNSIGNPGDRTAYNQEKGDLDFSMFQAQEGGGFFDNFDFKGYFKGEQGLIPDYKGESTKKTVNTAIDKYGDAVNTGLDVAQTAMTGVGMIPVVGNVVDLVNTGVSGVRAGVAGLTGDSDGVLKHTENMAINAGSAIPGIGIGVGAAGLAKDTATYTGLIDDKSIAANLGVGEPDFDKTQVTQAIGVGDQGDAKSKAGRGYELPSYQEAGETKKERKNRIKNYNHPYLQEYIELFRQNNKSDETAIKDIMSQMNVTDQDTLFLGNSPSLSHMTMRPEFNLDLFLASQKDPDAFNAGQPVNVTYEDREKYDIDDRTYMNDVGNYLHLIKSSLNQKQDGGANTLYEYYTGMGQDLPTISDRRTMFQDAGLGQQYSGTAAQNNQLLSYLQDPANITVPDDQIQQNLDLDEFTVTANSNNNNSMSTNDDPQDFSLFNNPVGPVANNEGEGSNLITEPGQLTANLINNQALPGGDGSGNLTEDGTATTQIQDFDVISDANTTVPNPTATNTTVEDVVFDPKVTRRNKFAGTVNRIMDSPGMKAFADVSGAAVAGANVVNAFFDERNFNKAKQDLVYMGMADKAYGMYEERDGDRGNFDENTGLMQPDNMRGYMARMGTETFMQPPIKQEENIVDLDYKTVAKLISAGADIEIL